MKYGAESPHLARILRQNRDYISCVRICSCLSENGNFLLQTILTDYVAIAWRAAVAAVAGYSSKHPVVTSLAGALASSLSP